MIVLGLDLSYTSTGIVVARDGQVVAWDNVWTTTKYSDDERRDKISGYVIRLAVQHLPELVLIEDYAFSKVQGAARLGELGGVVKHELWTNKFRYGTVQPMRLKKLAGSGKFSKDEMIRAAQQHWPECPDISDVADAYWAARYGEKHYLDYVHPA